MTCLFIFTGYFQLGTFSFPCETAWSFSNCFVKHASETETSLHAFFAIKDLFLLFSLGVVLELREASVLPNSYLWKLLNFCNLILSQGD